MQNGDVCRDRKETVAARALEEGKRGCLLNSFRVFFTAMKRLWNLIEIVVVQHYENTKCHCNGEP